MSCLRKRLQTAFLPLLFLSFFFLSFNLPVRANFLYVLVSDAPSSNRIYGFDVNETTGGLTLLPGFPVSTGFAGGTVAYSEQMVYDTANQRLYAINSAAGNVSAYSVDSVTGALTPLPFSPIALGPADSWASIKVAQGGSPLFAGRGSGLAASFNITPASATPAAGSPFAVPSIFSMAINRNADFLYLGELGVGAYAFDPVTGVLTPTPGSPFAAGSVPVAYDTDTFDRLFLANFNAGQVRAFSTVGGGLTAAAGNPFPAIGLTDMVDGEVHPSQLYYAVAARASNNVGIFQISGSGTATTLTQVPGSPVPSGGTLTNTLAFNGNGTFLFAGNGNTRNVTTYSVNPLTGAIANTGTQPADTLGATGVITGIAYQLGVTAANVSVSGRVLTPDGSGVPKAFVTMRDASGNIRQAAAGSFGHYRFDEVRPGETYFFSVSSKRYLFSDQVVTVNEDLTSLDFTALK